MVGQVRTFCNNWRTDTPLPPICKCYTIGLQYGRTLVQVTMILTNQKSATAHSTTTTNSKEFAMHLGLDIMATMATGAGKTSFYCFLMQVIHAISQDPNIALVQVREFGNDILEKSIHASKKTKHALSNTSTGILSTNLINLRYSSQAVGQNLKMGKSYSLSRQGLARTQKKFSIDLSFQLDRPWLFPISTVTKII